MHVKRLALVLAALAVSLVATNEPAEANTFVVRSTGDTSDANPGDGVCADASGICTFRAAIQESNAHFGPDFITFILPGPSYSIFPGSPLPPITAAVTIDGYTQPGATPNTNPVGQVTNSELKIRLAGFQQVPRGRAIRIEGGAGTTVRGLAVNSFEYGVEIVDSSSNVIEGNYFGLSTSGGCLSSPILQNGVLISGTSSNNTVGGTLPRARNVISDNGSAITIEGPASDNRVQGNFIGPQKDGQRACDHIDIAGRPSQDVGVDLKSGTTNNLIGGTDPEAGNLISGNERGITIRDSTSTGNVIQGNLIGLDLTGTASIRTQIGSLSPSFQRYGIDIDGAVGNTIGGSASGTRNVISGSQLGGIRLAGSSNVVQGNFIGTDISGTETIGFFAGTGVQVDLGASDNLIGGTTNGEGNVIAFHVLGVNLFENAGTGNAILGNSIHSNGGGVAHLGIDLGSDGLTLNDPGDTDAGPNNLQNFPEIESARAGSTIVDGTFDSTPDTTFRLEFFSNAECDINGFGEGEMFIGSLDVTTDPSGHTAFSATLAQTVAAGRLITATATDPDDNTSEFSECVRVGQEPFVVDSTGDAPDNAPGDGQCDDGSGSCTLRAAIEETRALDGPDAIHFGIPGDGPHTIRPQSPLPSVSVRVVIDGYTQPGSSPNTNDLSQGLNTVLMIEINGAGTGSIDGLRIGSGSVVRGLAINGFGGLGFFHTGFGLDIGDRVKVEGNFIGTSVAGDVAVGNTRGGIKAGSGNTIGGASPAAANLISGNGGSSAPEKAGIDLRTGGNIVQGNLIGTDITGALELSNDGAGVVSREGNLIGGPQLGDGNVIAGNAEHGILLQEAVGSLIQGNLIGTAADGVSPLGNSGSGVYLARIHRRTPMDGVRAAEGGG